MDYRDLSEPITGAQLSWESTCLASRGSRVRISPSPLAENLVNTSEAKYEPSRSRVDAVSENERKRSLSLQIDQTENLANKSTSQYKSSRSRVNVLNEYKRKRSMSLVVDLAES